MIDQLKFIISKKNNEIDQLTQSTRSLIDLRAKSSILQQEKDFIDYNNNRNTTLNTKIKVLENELIQKNNDLNDLAKYIQSIRSSDRDDTSRSSNRDDTSRSSDLNKIINEYKTMIKDRDTKIQKLTDENNKKTLPITPLDEYKKDEELKRLFDLNNILKQKIQQETENLKNIIISEIVKQKSDDEDVNTEYKSKTSPTIEKPRVFQTYKEVLDKDIRNYKKDKDIKDYSESNTILASKLEELEYRIHACQWVAYDPDREEIWHKMSTL